MVTGVTQLNSVSSILQLLWIILFLNILMLTLFSHTDEADRHVNPWDGLAIIGRDRIYFHYFFKSFLFCCTYSLLTIFL